MKLDKTILIVGGMGPTASQFAHKLILEKCIAKGAKNNDDFPTIIHLSINVEDFIDANGNKLQGLNYIRNKLDLINVKSINVGFIACNTAHVFFDEINEKCGGKLISIIESAKKVIKQNDKIGIVCTPFTASHNVYSVNSLYVPSKAQFKELNSIIRNVIKGKIDDETISRFSTIVHSLRDRGCNKIIIGCTELSILADQTKNDFADDIFIDPIQIITDRICG